MKVVRKHRAAIGYTLDDFKGISPTLCQHKINMEPDGGASEVEVEDARGVHDEGRPAEKLVRANAC